MFNVLVNTGPSQAFTVLVDRVPVAGDYITDAQGNAWLITWVQMRNGGGTDAGGKREGREQRPRQIGTSIIGGSDKQ